MGQQHSAHAISSILDDINSSFWNETVQEQIDKLTGSNYTLSWTVFILVVMVMVSLAAAFLMCFYYNDFVPAMMPKPNDKPRNKSQRNTRQMEDKPQRNTRQMEEEAPGEELV